jgi:hypothetical protein
MGSHRGYRIHPELVSDWVKVYVQITEGKAGTIHFKEYNIDWLQCIRQYSGPT